MERNYPLYLLEVCVIVFCGTLAYVCYRNEEFVTFGINVFLVGFNTGVTLWNWLIVDPAHHGWQRSLDGWKQAIDRMSKND